MKKLIVLAALLAMTVGLWASWGSIQEVGAQISEIFYGDPDSGPFETGMSREEFMAMRSEGIALKRGMDKDKPVDPQLRVDAVRQLERQEDTLSKRLSSPEREALLAAWTEIGPNPIPNGQVQAGAQLSVSGRTVGIAVDFRRRNRSEESLALNLKRLQEYKSKLVILKKGDAAPDARIAGSTTIQPIVKKAASEIVMETVTPAMKEFTAYTAMRVARQETRVAGYRISVEQRKKKE